MTTKFITSLLLSFAVTALPFFIPQAARAADGSRIVLPAPDKEGGKPLMQALALRKSTREFGGAALSQQDLSNLLWATWGTNRPDGRRTAPTARNTQKVEVYAAMGSGVWRYDGEEHALIKELARDTRKGFGGAPLTLVYAAEDNSYGAMHLGSLYQNAGLYCASAGLNNVVKATGADILQKELKLPSGYKIMIVQSIGMPN